MENATPLRYVLLLAAALCISCSSEKSLVDDFKALVKDAEAKTNTRQEAYFNENVEQWARRKFEVRDLRIDVKKTESLTSPYTAIAAFKLLSAQTPLSATRADAEAHADPDLTESDQFDIIIRYQFNDKWIFSSGQSKFDLPILGETNVIAFEFDRKTIESDPTAVPNAAILYWFSSK